jgi:hypothetical protein
MENARDSSALRAAHDMHRYVGMSPRLLLVLPFTLLAACSAQSSDDSATSGADVVGVSDLGALEQHLALVRDPGHTRPENILINGPCYTQLDTPGPSNWNLRRYTNGAAFFLVAPNGSPLNPLVCVDFDVASGDGTRTVGLSGLSLDIAQRYPLGSFTRAEPVNDPITHEYQQNFVFSKAALSLAVLPPRIPHDFAPTEPSYEMDFRGDIVAFDASFVPEGAHEALPHVANMVYQFAKSTGSTSMANDPIGYFQSAQALPHGTDLAAWYSVQFEKAFVDYTRLDAQLGTREVLTLKTGLATLQTCTRDHRNGNPAAASWKCE